jgi:hypothetical protein
MSRTRTNICAALAIAFAMYECTGTYASTVYDYTGNLFTVATPPYTTSDRVTGYIDVAQPIGDNRAENIPFEPGDSFSFTDGIQTLTNYTYQNNIFDFPQFYVVTNSSGAIIQWNIGLIDPSNHAHQIITLSQSNGSGDYGISMTPLAPTPALHGI